MSIARLTPQDAETFRALRLESLGVAPFAYATALEEEADRPLPWFAGMLETSAVFVAHDLTGMAVGMLGFRPDMALKRRHIGYLWGMYVRADQRGRGVGAALMVEAMAHARDKVAVLQLAVGAGNPGAIRLYERAGFAIYGTELASLRLGGVDATSHLMAHHFP